MAQRKGVCEVPNRTLLLLFLLPYLCLGISSCGGSGGGGGQQPPPTPDFSLSTAPASVSITAGASATTLLNATGLNGFTSQVSVQVSGLPAGVTLSPTTITLVPGTPTTVTLTASASAQPTGSAANAVFTGTSGSLVHTANLSVSVTSSGGDGGGGGGSPNSRTKYIRDDAATEYYLWLNSHWVIYNKSTSRFFVTDPFSNQIFVFDSVTESKIGAITVPGVFGIDQTPDQGTIWVGTLVGDVYSIDPAKMAVKQRYLAAQIGPYGYPASSALVLSDGRLALLGPQGGIPSVDGSTTVAVWNPSSNAITIYGSTGNGSVPSSPYCATMENIGGFALTADRTAILIGSIDSDGTVCQINAATGNLQSIQVAGSLHIIVSPDGKYLLFRGSSDSDLSLYDAKTFTLVSQFNVNGDIGSDLTAVFSPDSKTIYLSNGQFVYSYSVATGAQTGWTPNIYVTPTSGGFAVGAINGPNFAAFDGSGLLAGPLEEGFAFIDTAAMRTGPVGTGFTNAYLNPATGPTSGGTPVQIPVFPTETNQSKVYFGSTLAPSVSVSGALATIKAPAGSPGPVDVRLFANDGGMQLVPDGFSYGPSILEISSNLATADGGGTNIAYGYGFGDLNATSVPSSLAVTVGGKSAGVVGFNPNSYNVLGQPFPLEAVYYTIPAGTSGSSVDVAVTSSSGTGTAKGGLSYLPAAKPFPLANASLAQGVYDPKHDLYYFSDTTAIQVFSRTQAKWLAPLVDLSAKGAQRLWGLALSPDGTKLVAADIQGALIYLIDPSNPASVKSFPFAPNLSGITADPAGVAVSDSGVVYIAAYIQGGTGFSSFFTLNTNTSQLTNLNLTGPGLGTDLYLRTLISADNSRVFFNDDGAVFAIDTSNGVVFPAVTGAGCCYGDYDLALSKNQIQFAASGYLYDSDLNPESFETLNDRDVNSGISYVYGSKLSPDGSLLFQPSTNGVDIFDGRLGTLLHRVALGFSLSTNYDALVEDGEDNVLVAITGQTGTGVAILDFSSVSEPPALPFMGAGSARPARTPSSLPSMKPRSGAQKSQSTPSYRQRIPFVTRQLPPRNR